MAIAPNPQCQHGSDGLEDYIGALGESQGFSVLVSRQDEKFLFGQSKKFRLTAARLEEWNELR